MVTPALRSLITYLISELTDMGSSFGKTKLVKLIYIIDVENYRRRSRTLSGLTWLFYHYGPCSFEIDTALAQLSLDIPQEEVTTQAGRTAVAFRPSKDLHSGLDPSISRAEKLVIDRVLHEWGTVELNPLLDYVYFYTEPMKDAQRGDLLDFFKIQRISPRTQPRHDIAPPKDKLDDLRSRFQEARARRVRLPLEPKPRFDEVYKGGLAHMDEAEDYQVPAGDLELTDQAKEHFRDEGDSTLGA
jgi:hypothetical protein